MKWMHFFHVKSLNLLFASGVWPHWYEFMFTLCANSHNSSGTFFRLDMQTWMVFGMQDDIPKEFWSCQRFWKSNGRHATSSMHDEKMRPLLSQPVVTGNRRAAGQEPAEWGDGAGCYGRLAFPGTGDERFGHRIHPPLKWCVSLIRGPRYQFSHPFWESYFWLKYLVRIPMVFGDGLRWLGMIGWLGGWVEDMLRNSGCSNVKCDQLV